MVSHYDRAKHVALGLRCSECLRNLHQHQRSGLGCCIHRPCKSAGKWRRAG